MFPRSICDVWRVNYFQDRLQVGLRGSDIPGRSGCRQIGVPNLSTEFAHCACVETARSRSIDAEVSTRQRPKGIRMREHFPELKLTPDIRGRHPRSSDDPLTVNRCSDRILPRFQLTLRIDEKCSALEFVLTGASIDVSGTLCSPGMGLIIIVDLSPLRPSLALATPSELRCSS